MFFLLFFLLSLPKICGGVTQAFYNFHIKLFSAFRFFSILVFLVFWGSFDNVVGVFVSRMFSFARLGFRETAATDFSVYFAC